MAPKSARLGLCWLAVLAAASCSADPAGGPSCVEDKQCEGAEVCHQGACVARVRLDCIEGGDAQPAIAAEPDALYFGFVAASPVRKSVALKNTGDCTLKITSATLEQGAGSRFRCVTCEASGYPVAVYPGRSWDVDLDALPGTAGSLQDNLHIESTAPSQPMLTVPLTAESEGMPALTVDPLSVDFGYVPVGQSSERVVQVVNAGLGSARIQIQSAVVLPSGATEFSVEPTITMPVTLDSARADPNARLVLTVRYRPQAVVMTQADLVITPVVGDVVRVPLMGRDQPPDISVSPGSVSFGTLTIGQSATRTVTIQNRGTTPLFASEHFGVAPATADLFVVRGLPFSIPAGGLFELGLSFAPTVAGPLQNTLVIESNDPDQPSISLAITGTAEALPGAEVVAIELSFTNDSDSALDRDLRDVDLILENPNGQICSEVEPRPINWGAFGNARWSAAGTKKNPERILLDGAQQDGTYTVNLSYVEDCSTLPTALAASLLGIGTESLVDYFSEGGVQLDPTEVASAVEQACVERKGPNARVKVSINGAPTADVPVSLSQKGQFTKAFDLVRAAGRFSVVP